MPKRPDDFIGELGDDDVTTDMNPQDTWRDRAPLGFGPQYGDPPWIGWALFGVAIVVAGVCVVLFT